MEFIVRKSVLLLDIRLHCWTRVHRESKPSKYTPLNSCILCSVFLRDSLFSDIRGRSTLLQFVWRRLTYNFALLPIFIFDGSNYIYNFFVHTLAFPDIIFSRSSLQCMLSFFTYKYGKGSINNFSSYSRNKVSGYLLSCWL